MTPVAAITETNQYLTFKLDEEYFTVEVTRVREILEFVKITKVPDAPPFMRGMINVRGGVVPVIDLRLKFGMSITERKVTTRIIVLEIVKEGKTLVIGALADAVKEVIELRPEQIVPAPDIGTRWKRELIKGVGSHNEEFVMILDLDKLFSDDFVEGALAEQESSTLDEMAAEA